MAILSELPDSVVSKILTRLPVKSLTQCRCVGKSWYNLISDPYFIWSHLGQRSAEEKGYLVTGHISKLCNEEHYSFRCDETFLEKLKIERTISESTGGFILVGCAKGLLLMLSLKTSDSDLHLWNTGLQKIKPLPRTHATHKYKFHLEAFGFAFLPEICDYKVIRILDFFFDVSRVEIYSLKTDSWRRIETPVMRLVTLHKGLILAAFVNPYFYWVGTTFQDNQCTDCIVSFDIKCETFKLTDLPVACLEDGHLEGTLAVFQESIYLFAYQIGEGWSRLWMMKENCNSGMYWSKLFIFEYEDRWPIGFMKNGDVIMKDVNHMVSLHDPGNVSNPWKSEREMKGEKRCSEVYNYSPSLALLNQRNGGD